MKQTITLSQFVDAFRDRGRDKQFSFAGLTVLYDYLESLEKDIGEEIELDVISLCCGYVEYANIADYLEDNSTGLDQDDYDNWECFCEEVKEEIIGITTFIDIDGESFIIANY